MPRNAADMDRINRSIRSFKSEIDRRRIEPYRFKGIIGRGLFKDNTGPFRPTVKKRDSKELAKGSLPIHRIQFPGWPIGEVVEVDSNDNPNDIMYPRGLILLRSGMIARADNGIFFDERVANNQFNYYYDIKTPSRDSMIDAGRLDSSVFPVAIGSLAMSHIKAARGPCSHPGVTILPDFLEQTMEMILEAG